jgi:hypothetical protein
MRHVWLAALVVVAFVGTAEAKHVSCTCPTATTVPEQGVAFLPANAKRWQLQGVGAVHYSTRPALADIVGLTISPIADDPATENPIPADTIAPEAPRDLSFSIGANAPSYRFSGPQSPQVTIAAFGRYDNETVLVRIDIHDRDGVVTLLTTPRRLYLCEPGLIINGDKVDIEVRSIDAAGNESAPFTATVDVITTAGSENSCGNPGIHEHEHHHGHGFEILFLLMLFPAGLIAWLVVVLVRRASIKRQLAEPLSLLAAEAVVRRLLRWQIVWSVMLLAGTLLTVAYIDDDYWIFFAPFLFSSFGQVFLQRRALSLLDRPEADAARRGQWLVVTTLKDSAAVRAADIDFVVANKRGIPTSVVK